MAQVYHVTTIGEWNAAQATGAYRAASLEKEGFIHCSEAHQVAGVLQRYFSGKTGLVRLTIDTEQLSAELKYELAPSVNEYFPHIYGALNIDAVIEVVKLQG